MSECAACQKRGKTWQGDDARCAFRDGQFSPDNWNCATVNMLRDLVYEGQKTMPANVDYRYCDDMKYATVQTEVADALALWVCWYKNRGTTDQVWLLFADAPPRVPTESEVLAVVEGAA